MALSVVDAVAQFQPALPLAIAFSGGADSTALLIACALRWPGQIRAIHVNHGLQAQALVFEQHCQQVCDAWAVPLTIERVHARHAQGQSPEDAARVARYAALDAAMVRAAHNGSPCQSIALGQHADDQAETLILALSRGAGVAGLACMPRSWQRAGVDWYRPLLSVAAADIRHWLRERGQLWVEDPTNAQLQYTRNRIRAVAMPALEQVFPGFRSTFQRSTVNCAQAQELLTDLAIIDMERIGCPPVIGRLQSLRPVRQGNVIRHWLQVHHQTTPSAAQLSQLLSQIAACKTRGHQLHLKVGRGYVVRCKDVLDWYNGAGEYGEPRGNH